MYIYRASTFFKLKMLRLVFKSAQVGDLSGSFGSSGSASSLFLQLIVTMAEGEASHGIAEKIYQTVRRC